MRRGALLFLTMLAAAPAHAAGWYEARSDHFIVYAQGDIEAARTQAIALERFDKGMRRLQHMPDDPAMRGEPLTVFVLADQDAVARACAQTARQRAACSLVAGFYDGRASGSYAFTSRQKPSGEYDLNPQAVLFHEYAHHMMFRHFAAAYPAWYVEGFAEFNSTARIEPDGRMIFGAPANARAYELVRLDQMPSAKLLDAHWIGPYAYGWSWALTHYLAFSKARAGQLNAYLAKVAAGTPSQKAGREVFGDLIKLDFELKYYLKQKNLASVVFEAKETEPGAVAVRELGAGEAAIMPVRMRSKRGVDKAGAQAVVRDARALAQPFSDDPIVQDALAEAEYDAGNDEAARAAADRALAASPGDRIAMLFEGLTRQRVAVNARQTDPKTWAEIRGWYIRANKVEANHAEPLMLFYQSYLAQGIKPTANAVDALDHAQALAPQDQALRMLLGRQFLIDGRKQDGRAVLVPLAFNPHAPTDNPAARLIDLIDKGDDKALSVALMAKPADAAPAAGAN